MSVPRRDLSRAPPLTTFCNNTTRLQHQSVSTSQNLLYRKGQSQPMTWCRDELSAFEAIFELTNTEQNDKSAATQRLDDETICREISV